MTEESEKNHAGIAIFQRVEREITEAGPLTTIDKVAMRKCHNELTQGGHSSGRVMDFAHRWVCLMEQRFKKYPQLQKAAERERELCEHAGLNSYSLKSYAGAIPCRLLDDDEAILEFVKILPWRDKFIKMVHETAYEAGLGSDGHPYYTARELTLASHYIGTAWRLGKPLFGLMQKKDEEGIRPQLDLTSPEKQIPHLL